MQQRTDQGPVYCGQKMNYCFITRITSGDSEGCDLAVNTQHCPNIGPSFLTNNAAGIIWAAPALCPPFTIDKLKPPK